MDNLMQSFMNLTTGFYVLATVAELVGFFVCLTFRRLSPWTILAALGFGGMFSAGILTRLLSLRWLNSDQLLFGPTYALTGAFHLLSKLTLVAGLGLTFADLRRRLAMALEPPHDRR